MESCSPSDSVSRCIWHRRLNISEQKSLLRCSGRRRREKRDVFSLLTWMSGWTGVTLGPPAAAVVAAALRVGDHHVVLGLAADQTLVNMEETHILVSCGAIWKNKGEDKPLRLNSPFRASTLEDSSSSGRRPTRLNSVSYLMVPSVWKERQNKNESEWQSHRLCMCI